MTLQVLSLSMLLVYGIPAKKGRQLTPRMPFESEQRARQLEKWPEETHQKRGLPADRPADRPEYGHHDHD